ncbi:hypothetical protein AB0903_09160 [Streptomyces sp. NPDC048389]|uniref:hypothetical protein n=1 Tax=Streptomyces sp. NPDC048389 TaxID=3154622 RepID=UPI003451AC4F
MLNPIDPFARPTDVHPARQAAQELAAAGAHVHLVSGIDIDCLADVPCPLPALIGTTTR